MRSNILTYSRTACIMGLIGVLLLFTDKAALAAIESLPADNPTYQSVKKIYDSIARAFGNGRLPPRLVVFPGSAKTNRSVAWSEAGSEGSIGVESKNGSLTEGYIAIEERAVNLLSKLATDRDNAVAFLLGHELTHYYMRHGWVGDFGNSFANTEVGRKMQAVATTEDAVKIETEADYYGGFYGYLAGYDTLRVAPKVLDLLYSEYKLPETIPSYPTRGERKAIASRTAANLERLLPLFEAANHLLIVEKYEDAGRLFAHLAQSFPSRELFSNAGVAYAQEALRLFRPGHCKYAYPFEFDAESRLRSQRQGSRGLDENAAKREQLLQKALDTFEQAIQRDKLYAVAYVNLACVQELLGDYNQAIVTARKGLDLASKGADVLTASNAQLVRGIAFAAAGDVGRARADFVAAGQVGNPLAAVNLLAFEGKPLAKASSSTELPGSGKENIAGVSPWGVFVKDKDVQSFTLNSTSVGQVPLVVHSRVGSEWKATLVKSGDKMVSIRAADPGYTGQTARGIKVGDSIQQVKTAYGISGRIAASRQGIWHIYPKSGIAFSIDASGKVNGWLIFAEG